MQGRKTVVTTAGRPAPSEAVREAVTMALYVGVVLAAEFVAVEEHAVDESSTVAVIWGTGLGVALAHVFAFNLAARLFAGGDLASGTRRAVWARSRRPRRSLSSSPSRSSSWASPRRWRCPPSCSLR